MDQIALHVWNFLTSVNEEHLKKPIDELVKKIL